jgi:hypothetical protein
MAYNVKPSDRIREKLADLNNIEEKEVIVYFLRGKKRVFISKFSTFLDIIEKNFNNLTNIRTVTAI